MTVPKNIIIEACVETIEQAKRAEDLGAHQIELCSNLSVGGLTPNHQLIASISNLLNIPVKVMVRPRGGNFVYSKQEMNQILTEIKLCAESGVREVVFGSLDQNSMLALNNLEEIMHRFPDISICFHKAIDECNHPLEAIKLLKKIPQIKSILSSGGAISAWEGRYSLKNMLNACGNQLNLIVAGKVTNHNLEKIHAEIGASYYHGRKILGKLD